MDVQEQNFLILVLPCCTFEKSVPSFFFFLHILARKTLADCLCSLGFGFVVGFLYVLYYFLIFRKEGK